MSNQIAQDAALASVATKTTVYGYVASMFGFLTDTSVAVGVGTTVTLVGFIMNWYYQRRRTQRETQAIQAEEARKKEAHEWAREEHLARMKKINSSAVGDS